MKSLASLKPVDKPGLDENGHFIGSDSPSFMDDLFTEGSSFAVSIFDWGIKAITILFVIGIIVMIMAFIFKHGQWQKYAQSTMMWSFIAMLILRGAPIIFLSLQTKEDIDVAMQTALSTLAQVAIFIGIVGICVSLLFKFGHTLIKHPEYYKWYKNARNVSIIMIVFSLVGPIIFALL
ncbi:hypothetical protein [Viridibacillus arvi]|uniref:hypothetical protein n=1 Tax=Viridibacillus arvi TaxID=263475 RepID=UPI003D273908